MDGMLALIERSGHTVPQAAITSPERLSDRHHDMLVVKKRRRAWTQAYASGWSQVPSSLTVDETMFIATAIGEVCTWELTLF